MDKIGKETFEKWVETNGWLLVNDIATANGRQYMYLTPAGAIIVATYDLAGQYLLTIGQPSAPVPGPNFLRGS